LNAPAGMVFIRSLVNRSLDYGHYTIVIAEFFDREGTSFTRADFGGKSARLPAAEVCPFLFADSERRSMLRPLSFVKGHGFTGCGKSHESLLHCGRAAL